MWKKLGVNVELVNAEPQLHTANLRQGDFEIGAGMWSADHNDATVFHCFAHSGV